MQPLRTHRHDVDCFMHPFSLSAPCYVILIMLVYATHWLSMHLYTLAYLFMQESCLLVCCPCFNTIKSWTSDPNLHLSFANTTFVCVLACFPFCLFACHLVCLPSLLLVCLLYLSCLFALCPFMLFASFPSIARLLVSCLCL